MSFITTMSFTKHRISRGGLLALGLPVLAGILACSTPEGPSTEGALATTTSAEQGPANILLITIDTLRADHLSSYGYPRLTSPVLDRLAAEGMRFDQPQAQWPKTGPSFASIFSSTYPKDNGIVRRVGRPVPPEFRMLAEKLGEHGYSNHAVVANGALAKELHYDQGFESYVETWKRGDEIHRDNRASVVTELARKAAAEHLSSEQPFFFWVHYIDPHGPYEPPDEWKDKFQGDEHSGDVRGGGDRQIRVRTNRRKAEMRAIGREGVLDGRTDLAFYIARYDAEIAYADSQIGELLEFLKDRGLLENTLTIITSDHGESLGEHDYYFGHGRFGFETCLRVPLILHYPGVVAPRVDLDPVELIHLGPTILEAAGVPLEDGQWMQGRSLFPRLQPGESAAQEPVYAFAEAGYAKSRRWQKIVRDRRYKLIHASEWADQRWITGKRKETFALFDLEKDPLETGNLAATLPDETTRLKRALHTWWNAEAFEVRREASDGTDQEDLDDKTREQLKALGYLN